LVYYILNHEEKFQSRPGTFIENFRFNRDFAVEKLQTAQAVFRLSVPGNPLLAVAMQ